MSMKNVDLKLVLYERNKEWFFTEVLIKYGFLHHILYVTVQNHEQHLPIAEKQ